MPSLLRRASFALALLGCFATFASPARADEEREPRLHTYAVGAGFSFMRYRVNDPENTRMGASGPVVTFDYSVGRRWAFGMRSSFMIPVHGSQTYDAEGGTRSESFNLFDMYQGARTGFEFTFLAQRRLHLNEHLDFVAGVGIHLTMLRLVSTQYQPVELISGGFGGIARVERAIGEHFYYGGQLSLGFDPLDFVKHDARAIFVAPVGLTAFVGVRR